MKIDNKISVQKKSIVGMVHGVFDIIDNSFNSVKTSNVYKRQASANTHAEVGFTLPPNPQKWTFNLQGSQGRVSISTELANNSSNKS